MLQCCDLTVLLRLQATKQTVPSRWEQVYHASCSPSSNRLGFCSPCRQKDGLHDLYAIWRLQTPFILEFCLAFHAFIAFADTKVVCSIFKDNKPYGTTL